MTEPTRGERNNNPGNIERNYVKWQGMADVQTDSRFVTYTDPHWGIRAIGKILLTNFKNNRKNRVSTSIRSILERYAPSIENNTGAYIDHVAKEVGITADAEVDVSNPDVLEHMVVAIIKHENGRCIYDDATIVKAIDSALL